MVANNLLRVYNDQAVVECGGYALDDGVLVLLDAVGYKTACKSIWASTVNSPRKTFRITGNLAVCGGEIKLTRYRAFWTELPEQNSHNLVICNTRLLDSSPVNGLPQPFYLVTDQEVLLLPRFIALLNQALDLPVLSSWAEFLFEAGQKENLVTKLTQGGNIASAWKVQPTEDAWASLIQRGLQSKTITMDSGLVSKDVEAA